MFSLREFRDAHKPFALSPVPNPTRRPKVSLLTRLTGLITVPGLGRLTSYIAGPTDAAIVERTWGLLSTVPSRQSQFYGPKFTVREFFRARSRAQGVAVHLAITFFGLLLAFVPPFRTLVQRMMVFQPGQGRSKEETAKDQIEYRAVAATDPPSSRRGFCRAWYDGGAYYCTYLGRLAS